MPSIETAIANAGAAARGIEIVAELDAAQQPVRCDRERLQQIVRYLLENALQFSPPKGIVHVALDRIGSSARLRVSDQGRRIDTATGPRMFESLRYTEGSGKGGLDLGLALARHLTELQGGEVTGSSPVEGAGATFEIRLPLAG